MANYAIMDKKYQEMFDTIDKVRAYLEPIADEKEYKKCMDWLRLLIKQYKVLNVKKKKFEIDTDFEE